MSNSEFSSFKCIATLLDLFLLFHQHRSNRSNLLFEVTAFYRVIEWNLLLVTFLSNRTTSGHQTGSHLNSPFDLNFGSLGRRIHWNYKPNMNSSKCLIHHQKWIKFDPFNPRRSNAIHFVWVEFISCYDSIILFIFIWGGEKRVMILICDSDVIQLNRLNTFVQFEGFLIFFYTLSRHFHRIKLNKWFEKYE